MERKGKANRGKETDEGRGHYGAHGRRHGSPEDRNVVAKVSGARKGER